MKRNLGDLVAKTHDLLIIGGGIYGACLAREAALAGLNVALVEKSDFGGATSANSLKVIHGGLRYLQHADLKRARSSICERKTLLRIAPHLVHPLPVLIPTYGHGVKGKEILAMGLLLNDLVGWDRNHQQDPQKHIPQGRVVAKEKCLELLPGLRSQNVTGGGIFFDASVHNSERLTLSFLHSAVEAGACIANYVEVTDFLQRDNAVTGVIVKNISSGDIFAVQARLVVNTTGPWSAGLLSQLHPQLSFPVTRLAKAFNLVIRRQLVPHYAVGIAGQKQFKDKDALLQTGSRFFFIVPWRGHSMIGTEYIPFDDKPDNLKINAGEIQAFIQQINQAYPDFRLTLDDISLVHKGLVPISGIDPHTGGVRLTKHHHIVDHTKDGIAGLISVVGVKYTTARLVAQQTLRHLFTKWELRQPVSQSARKPVFGGQIQQFDDYVKQEIDAKPYSLPAETIRRLIYNYGTAYKDVLMFLDNHVPDSLAAHKAEIFYAIRHEMAQKLTDVVLRRTDMGSAGHPGAELLRFCAQTMAAEMKWTQSRTEQEIANVNALYNSWRNDTDDTSVPAALTFRDSVAAPVIQ